MFTRLFSALGRGLLGGLFGVLRFLLWFPATIIDTVWDRLTNRDVAPMIRAEELEADKEVARNTLEIESLEAQIAAEEARKAEEERRLTKEAERQRMARERQRMAEIADRRVVHHGVNFEDEDEEELSYVPGM